jgi:hypothetical protein
MAAAEAVMMAVVHQVLVVAAEAELGEMQPVNLEQLRFNVKVLMEAEEPIQ